MFGNQTIRLEVVPNSHGVHVHCFSITVGDWLMISSRNVSRNGFFKSAFIIIIIIIVIILIDNNYIDS